MTRKPLGLCGSYFDSARPRPACPRDAPCKLPPVRPRTWSPQPPFWSPQPFCLGGLGLLRPNLAARPVHAPYMRMYPPPVIPPRLGCLYDQVVISPPSDLCGLLPPQEPARSSEDVWPSLVRGGGTEALSGAAL